MTQVHQAIITSEAVLMNSGGFGDPYRVRSIVDVLRGAVLLLLRWGRRPFGSVLCDACAVTLKQSRDSTHCGFNQRALFLDSS